MDPSGTVPDLEPVEPPFVAGWALLGPSPALRTVDGLTIGARIEDFLALYPDAYPGSDPATWEVFLGDFSNLSVEATGPDPADTVTTMISGSVCPRS